MNGTLVALALGLIFACSSTPALSADASVSSSRPNHFNVEVKPLLFLANMAPGSRGVAGGLELPMSEHVAAYATASFLSLKLPTDTVSSSKDDATDPSKPTIQQARTGAVQGGLRYYGHVSSDSWYAGAGGGAGTSQITWKRDGETLNDKSSSYSAELEAGYRWLWNSGFLLRVGAELSANNIRERTISALSTTASPEAVDAVTKESGQRKNTVTTGFDFGLGWAF